MYVTNGEVVVWEMSKGHGGTMSTELTLVRVIPQHTCMRNDPERKKARQRLVSLGARQTYPLENLASALHLTYLARADSPPRGAQALDPVHNELEAEARAADRQEASLLILVNGHHLRLDISFGLA